MKMCRCVKYSLGHPPGNIKRSVGNCWFNLYLPFFPPPKNPDWESLTHGNHIFLVNLLSFSCNPPPARAQAKMQDFIRFMSQKVTMGSGG